MSSELRERQMFCIHTPIHIYLLLSLERGVRTPGPENPSSGYLIYAQVLTLFLEQKGDTGSSLSSANDFGQSAGAEGVHASNEASIRRIISEINDENLPSLSSELSHALQVRMARDQRSHAQDGT
jgi:hypothetical protein